MLTAEGLLVTTLGALLGLALTSLGSSLPHPGCWSATASCSAPGCPVQGNSNCWRWSLPPDWSPA
jgi:hypothetical protein